MICGLSAYYDIAYYVNTCKYTLSMINLHVHILDSKFNDMQNILKLYSSNAFITDALFETMCKLKLQNENLMMVINWHLLYIYV